MRILANSLIPMKPKFLPCLSLLQAKIGEITVSCLFQRQRSNSNIALSIWNSTSSIQLFFCGNWSGNDVTPFCMQFEKQDVGVVYNFFFRKVVRQNEGEIEKGGEITHFPKCMENDVTLVRPRQSRFRKKTPCILLRVSKKDRKDQYLHEVG